MSVAPLVLVTGSNGFVGYAVLVGALKAGYRVRAAVRRQDAIYTISRPPSVNSYLSNGGLTFTIVPDNTKQDAYTESARECSYIIHVASPLPTEPGNLILQAVAGTKAILEAASATKSVKRVILTASTASLRPFERLLAEHPDNQAVMCGQDDQVPTMTAETRVQTQPETSDDVSGFRKYTDSKIAALNYTDSYKGASFSIVNIMPGWILGQEELTQTKREAMKGSNIILSWLFSDLNLGPLVGKDGKVPVLAETVHLDDVVESHVKALDMEKVLGQYRNYLLCTEQPKGPRLMDAADIVRREFPKEVANGKIPFAGELDTTHVKFDATSTERDLLGHAFLRFEKQVKDTIGWYISLPD